MNIEKTSDSDIKQEEAPKKQRQSSSFANDVLKLVTGTTFAQALSILVAPILTRMYAPDAFGVAALFVSITSIISIISCMRYELSIMLPKTDEEAANLLGLSLGIVLLVSLLTTAVIWLGKQPLLNWLNAPELASYLWLIPLMVLINGILLALNYWNSRTKHFGRLSVAQVVKSFTTVGGKLGIGLAGVTTAGSLIGATVLGSVTTTITLGTQTWRDDGQTLQKSINWRDMVAGLKRYRKFPLYSTWTAFLNVLSWQAPVILLSAFFSPTVVGFYSLGNRVVRLPMALIGNSIAQVFFQRASETKNTGSLTYVVRSVFERLVLYGLFPVLLLTFVGQELFVTVFGNAWTEAGVYTQILSLYIFFNFISAPLGQLFSVLEKQEVALIVNIILLLSRIGALWIGGSIGNAKFALVLFSLSGILAYGGYSIWILRMSGVYLKDWAPIILKSLLVSGVLLSISGFICFYFNLNSWKLLLVYSLGTIFYYVWVLKQDANLQKLLQQKLIILRRRSE